MAFSRFEKINALAALDINQGNVTETAEQFGVSRLTIYNWQKQLEQDTRLLAQVEAAKKNLANLEELNALRAIGEIGRRLDEAPEKVKTQDLIKIKDSGINNSRLIRGQATSIVQDQPQMLGKLVDFCRTLTDDPRQLAGLVYHADGSGIDEGLRRAEAERILAEVDNLVDISVDNSVDS